MGETIHGGAIWGSVKKSDLLAGVALALLFAAFFRALVGATTFRSMGEVGFLIGASSALALGLLVGITTALPARLPAILAASMAAGALVDSLVAVVIGRASTVALTLVLVLLGLAALAAYLNNSLAVLHCPISCSPSLWAIFFCWWWQLERCLAVFSWFM